MADLQENVKERVLRIVSAQSELSIDVVRSDGASAALRERILREGEVLYDRR